MALAQGQSAAAFRHFLGSLTIHRAIADALGEAGDHGYLARAATSARAFRRATLLAGAALRILEEIDDRFGQRLALLDGLQAFLGLEDHRAAFAALYLAWARASEIGDPAADRLGQQLTQTGLEISVEDGPDSALVAETRQLLDEAFARIEAELAERGVGLYDPLEAEDDPT